MAEMAVADGIETIVVTPHQLGNFTKNSGAIIRAAIGGLQRQLDKHGVPLKVFPVDDVASSRTWRKKSAAAKS